MKKDEEYLTIEKYIVRKYGLEGEALHKKVMKCHSDSNYTDDEKRIAEKAKEHYVLPPNSQKARG